MRLRRFFDASLSVGCVLFFLAATASISSAQLKDSVSIQIHSKWVGLGRATESAASVEQRSGRCYINGKLASTAVVEDLFRELSAPADSPSLANLGITKSWLDQNAAPAFSDHAKDQPKVDRDRFLASFRNESLIEKLLPELVHGGWTDDYPTLELMVQRNGKETTIKSTHQNIFMIPFEINENGKTRLSYNAKLAEAIVALLPEKFTNRDRLSGNGLRSLVADKVIVQIRNS